MRLNHVSTHLNKIEAGIPIDIDLMFQLEVVLLQERLILGEHVLQREGFLFALHRLLHNIELLLKVLTQTTRVSFVMLIYIVYRKNFDLEDLVFLLAYLIILYRLEEVFHGELHLL